MADYCRNCGNQMSDNGIVCPSCQTPVNVGVSFCQYCGASTTSEQAKCPRCLHELQPSWLQNKRLFQKSRSVACVLGLGLGFLGVHNFYLGRTKTAVFQLLLTCLSFLSGIFIFLIFVPMIWAVLDVLALSSGKISTDAYGIPLRGRAIPIRRPNRF